MVLSGATTTEQLRSNVSALSLQLGDSTLQALGTLKQPPETYWASRAQLDWN